MYAIQLWSIALLNYGKWKIKKKQMWNFVYNKYKNTGLSPVYWLPNVASMVKW